MSFHIFLLNIRKGNKIFPKYVTTFEEKIIGLREANFCHGSSLARPHGEK